MRHLKLERRTRPLLLRALTFLALAAACAACASASEQLVPFPSQSVELSRPELCRIYVFRSSQAIGAVRSMRVFDQDREIGTLNGNDYLCWERGPGRALLRLVYEGPAINRGEQEDLFDLKAEAGSVLYFEADVRQTSEFAAHGENRGSPELTPLSAEQGRELLKTSKPVAGG